MLVDRVTKAKVESLIAEFRAWAPGEVREGVEDLARRFRLDPMIVKRIAQNEGIDISPEPKPSLATSNSATDFIRVEDVEEFGRKQGK